MNNFDQYGVEYSEDWGTLLKAPKDLFGEYYVKSGVTTIAKSAFEGCERLISVHIPASFKKLEYSAFKGCKCLASIYYNGGLYDWLLLDWNSGFETGYKLYLGNTLLEDVSIPLPITEIKSEAFYYCKSIKRIILHGGVSSIGEGAFNKSSLTGEVELPEGVSSIGPHAFFNSDIHSVSLPRSITRIGDGAFAACYSLQSFFMPENDKFMVDGGRAIIHKANLTEEFKKKSSLQRFLENPDDVEENTLIAFAGAELKEPYVIPPFVSSFAKDTFCYSTLGKTGIWLKHEMIFLDDAFRDAKGTVCVLPKLKQYYYKDFPKGVDLTEKFDPQYAFKSDDHQVTAVVENPYRILGVYANASQKDITANARKIKRYLEVGKEVDFPTDFNGILPPIKRTAEMVDKALADISTIEGKWKNALFWFVKVDEVDDIALGHLQSNNIEKAKTIWDKKYKWNYRLNLSSLYLLSSDIDESSSAIYFLYSGQEPFEKRILQSQYNAEINYEDFLRCVLGDYNSGDIYHGDLEEAYLDGLLVNVDMVDLRAMYSCNNFLLNSKLQRHYLQQIEDAIQAAKNVKANDHDASHAAVNNLLRSAYLLDEYKAYFGADDEKYNLIADNFASQLLQSAINYYNSAEDDYEESGHIIADWAVTAAEKALEIATSQIRKDRCQQNLEILRRNSSRIPPKEIKGDEDAVEELLTEHCNTENTIAQAYALLKDSVPYLCHIKEYIEKCKYSTQKTKPNDILLRLATNVVAMALNKLIADVNNATKANSKVWDTVQKAWEVTLSMDNFPVQQKFKDERYKPNKQTLSNLYDKASPLGQLGLGSVTRKTIEPKTYPILDLKTDEEVWKTCGRVYDYQHYLDLYPNGKHKGEAIAKIRQLTEEEENRFWEKAVKDDTIQSYLFLIDKHPHGAHAQQALARLAEKDNELYIKCQTLQDLQEYLKTLPNGIHRAEAEQRIATLESNGKKDAIVKGICIWLIVASGLTIALAIISMYVANQVLIGWIVGVSFAYLAGIMIYVGVKSQDPEEKKKVTSITYRRDDYELAYGITAFTIIEVLTFLVCYLTMKDKGDGDWIIAGIGASATLWIFQIYRLLYWWLKEKFSDWHLAIIKKRENKNK